MEEGQPAASDGTATNDDHVTKVFRDVLLGFVRIHVLHHAIIRPVYGAGIFRELSRHGYRLSWGTLYPLLHGLADEGLLAQTDRIVGGKVRKYYRITSRGRSALEEARRSAIELVEEIMEPE